MNIVKNKLRSRMENEWMNESLGVSIEKGILYTIDMEFNMNSFNVWKLNIAKNSINKKAYFTFLSLNTVRLVSKTLFTHGRLVLSDAYIGVPM